MWEGRELLGTVLVRWRRKHYESESFFIAGFVYAFSFSEFRICYTCCVIMAVFSRQATYYFGSGLPNRLAYFIDHLAVLPLILLSLCLVC